MKNRINNNFFDFFFCVSISFLAIDVSFLFYFCAVYLFVCIQTKKSIKSIVCFSHFFAFPPKKKKKEENTFHPFGSVTVCPFEIPLLVFSIPALDTLHFSSLTRCSSIFKIQLEKFFLYLFRVYANKFYLFVFVVPFLVVRFTGELKVVTFFNFDNFAFF